MSKCFIRGTVEDWCHVTAQPSSGWFIRFTLIRICSLGKSAVLTRSREFDFAASKYVSKVRIILTFSFYYLFQSIQPALMLLGSRELIKDRLQKKKASWMRDLQNFFCKLAVREKVVTSQWWAFCANQTQIICMQIIVWWRKWAFISTGFCRW